MAQSIVRAKYCGLSGQQLSDKAYELGSGYEMRARSCSQSTIASICELLKVDKLLVKVASSSSGGQAAQAAGTCGGLIGGTMVLDYFFGRPREKISYKREVKGQPGRVLRSGLKVAKLLYDKYMKQYGTILCPYIQTQLFGRSYVLSNPEELKMFDELGGSQATHRNACTPSATRRDGS